MRHHTASHDPVLVALSILIAALASYTALDLATPMRAAASARASSAWLAASANVIGSREGSRNRRRLKANQTGKKFRVGIKSNISTNRNNLISGVDRCIHLNAMKKTTITSINRQTIKI